MSTTDIEMRRSAPTADTGATVTKTEEPSMTGLGVILGVLSSTEYVEYGVRANCNSPINSTLMILYLKW